MKKLAALLLFCFSACLQAATIIPPYSMSHYDRDIQQLYATLSKQNITQRIENISAAFLGKPYLDDALGEGANSLFDQGPLYRTDAFDCVTYVSTVLALAISNNLSQFQQVIKNINYNQPKIAFVTRNHFMSADWNKVNAQQGYIRDVTTKVVDTHGKPIAQFSTITINKPAWFRKKSASQLHLLQAIKPEQEQQLLQHLHDLANQVQPVTVTMPYLPLSKLFNKDGEANEHLFAQIPSGTIIEIVRPDWDLTKQIGTKMLVSHLGFAIRTPQGLMYREASSLQHRVIDIPLAAYLKGYLTSQTVKGINVHEVLKPTMPVVVPRDIDD